jgi:hypothetical protein
MARAVGIGCRTLRKSVAKSREERYSDRDVSTTLTAAGGVSLGQTALQS